MQKVGWFLFSLARLFSSMRIPAGSPKHAQKSHCTLHPQPATQSTARTPHTLRNTRDQTCTLATALGTKIDVLCVGANVDWTRVGCALGQAALAFVAVLSGGSCAARLSATCNFAMLCCAMECGAVTTSCIHWHEWTESQRLICLA